jgi:hypothetical protein
LIKLNETISNASSLIKPICLSRTQLHFRNGNISYWIQNEIREAYGTYSAKISEFNLNESFVNDKSYENITAVYIDQTERNCIKGSGSGLFIENNGKFYLVGIASHSMSIRNCNKNFNFNIIPVTDYFDFIEVNGFIKYL